MASSSGDKPLFELDAKELARLAQLEKLDLSETRRIVESARLEAQTGISGELLYGLTTHGEIPALDRLLNQAPAALRDKLAASVRDGAMSGDVGLSLEALEALRPRYETIAHVAERAGFKIPRALRTALQGRKIETLSDIVEVGGIRQSPGLAAFKDDPAAASLDALAEFSLLPQGMEAGPQLYRAGYRGIVDVARKSPKALATSLEARIDPLAAERLRHAAMQQSRIALNFVTGQLVKGQLNLSLLGGQSLLLANVCHCCSDAGGALNYLGDLLDYTVRHVSYAGNTVDLAFLKSRLHQPFGDLPVQCADDTEVLRQVRICIEVLRDMLPAPQKSASPREYLESAYRRFLELFGTSFDEIRALPAMSAADADALAASLEVRSATRLADLRRDPDAVAGSALEITEAWLEQTFGLRDTTKPPLDAGTANPWTLEAGLDYWHRKWRSDDADDAKSPLGAHPLLDPDIVDHADLAELPAPKWQTVPNKTQWSALDFIDARGHWIDTCVGTLNGFRKPPGAAARTLAQMLVALAQPLTLPDVATALMTADLVDVNDPLKRLIVQRRQRDRQIDISAWLAQVNLSDEEFELLSRMAVVESRGQAITESEWNDWNAVMVQRAKKLEVLQTWRDEERHASAPISLSPQLFHLRSSIDAPDWTPTAWRSDAGLRRKWELALRGRIAQEQAVADAVQAAVDTVEHELLVALRDDHMRAAAALGLLGGGAGLLTPERRKWFTANLLIDGETSDCARTTRVEQAIKTVQGLLFGIRNGLLEDTVWDIDDPDFDATWQWLGAYSTWSAAMQIFLHPQRALRPTLLKNQSPGFAAMVEACRSAGQLTLDAIRAIAAEYQRYFTDVCSLVPVAAHAAGLPKKTYFAIGRSSVSGAFMFSSWTEASGWGASGAPDQSPWTFIEWDSALQAKLRVSEEEIASLVPFCDPLGQRGVAVYARLRSIGQVDWAKSVWLGGHATPFSDCEVPPPILLTDQRRVLPLAGGTANNAASAWSLDTADTLVALRTASPASARLLVRAGASSAGMRKFGLVRADGAGLALAATVELAAAWFVPESGAPVVMGQKVLVANDALSQIGWIDFSGDQLRLVLATAQITGPAGTWPVALGGASRRTVFRAANLDGGGPRLLAFEYVDPPVPALWLSPVRTFVSVFSLAANALSFDHREALDLDYVSSPSASSRWVYYPDNGGSPDGVRWEKFIVMRSGFGPSGSANASRDDVFVHAPVRTEKYWGQTTDPHSTRLITRGTNTVTVQALLRWDANNAKFVASDVHWSISQSNALAVAGGSVGEWRVREDDQYFTVAAGSAQNRPERLLAFNPTTCKLALLAFDSIGRLQTRYLADSEIKDGSGGLAWRLAADDRLFTGRFLAPGSAAVVLVNFSSANFCVLDMRGDALVSVFSESDYRIESPGSQGMYMRPAGLYDATCMDIDADGLDEIILKPGSAAQLPGCSVWHGLPGQFVTVGTGVSFGGPAGVTEFDLLPMGANTQQQQDRAARIKLAYQQNSVPGREQNLLYLDEAYYFVAVELAIRLHDAGDLLAALDAIRTVYEYEATGNARLIAYKLVLDAGTPSYTRALDWLRDPLAPHAIAQVRKGAYRDYTRLLAARFLLDAADAQFTLAKPESVNFARELYLKVPGLLPAPAAGSQQGACAGLLGALTTTIGEGYWMLPQLRALAGSVRSYPALKSAVAQVAKIAASKASPSAKAGSMLKVMYKAKADTPTPLEKALEAARSGTAALLLPHAAAAQGGVKGAWVPVELNKSSKYVPAPSLAWCISEDTEEEMLRLRAENNLRKIRNCLNIAGLEQPYEPIASPERLDFGNVENAAQLRALTMPRLTPLPYRYEILIERAKQLAELARQIEQSLLSSLQYADQKRFELRKARQDLALTRAGVRLRDLQVLQADSARVGAELQRDQTQLEVEEYDGRLRAGRTFNEQLALDLQAGAVALQTMSAAAAWAGMVSPKTLFEWGGAATGPLAGSAQAATMASQLAAQNASLESQDEELRFKSTLSRQNLRIGTQNIESARDGVYIAMQERSIAQTQVRHAEEILDFLGTGQFGNLALYEWMSGVLEGVYRFFLQQATSMTRMAAAQLEARTQSSIPVTIRDDYAVPLETGMSSPTPGESQPFDSKGMTGSAQLLRSIYELDQYAFQINKRKLQLVETFSLVQLDTVAFQRFRETGVLLFDTPLKLFDSRFPGNYLRMVHRVRTSMVALIPSTTGIRATLSTSGISRVVIGDAMFSTKTVRRAPESVALCSAWNATGYFDLDPQPELLAFAEGAGVDSRWKFDMPPAANPMVDYDSIADILFTIEYTALHSPDYRLIVIKDLPRELAQDRAFSFRSDFADAWYELNNPDVCATPLTVSVDVRETDFPPNIDKATLLSRQLALYFVPSSAGASLAALNFKLTQAGGTAPVSYRQPDASGVASSRRGMTLPVGTNPVGTWKLEIKDSTAARKLFSDGTIRDILFVVSWEGTLPPWSRQ